ncbi:guanylate kinase [Bacillus thuringiensis]|uniref:guanylate kinase n=1 Tax=Bacillus thuringiensis TaxID=1428 RepID=UPI000BF4A503|nr:hypothetical protein [Bacillus thuringiensis]PEV64074.1 hypothetical protein CN434_25030 [Bacillus thuringiensis]
MNQERLVIVTGMSGAGKTYLSRNAFGDEAECVSHTTRPMREGERHARDYYFIDQDTYSEMLVNGAFAEISDYHGNSYGVTKKEIKSVIEAEGFAYVVVDFQGYQQLKQVYPNAIGVFIHASKDDCVYNMLKRGDSVESALKRNETYEEELKNKGHYDFVIKNERNMASLTIEILSRIKEIYVEDM